MAAARRAAAKEIKSTADGRGGGAPLRPPPVFKAAAPHPARCGAVLMVRTASPSWPPPPSLRPSTSFQRGRRQGTVQAGTSPVLPAGRRALVATCAQRHAAEGGRSGGGGGPVRTAGIHLAWGGGGTGGLRHSPCRLAGETAWQDADRRRTSILYAWLEVAASRASGGPLQSWPPCRQHPGQRVAKHAGATPPW